MNNTMEPVAVKNKNFNGASSWPYEEDAHNFNKAPMLHDDHAEGRSIVYKPQVSLDKSTQDKIEKLKNPLGDFRSQIVAKEFTVHAVYLKKLGRVTFEALYIINLEDFLSDRFYEVYDLALEYKLHLKESNFHISFSFTPSSHLNEDCLISDGFFQI